MPGEHDFMHTIDVIDTHTAGEPTRVVIAGFPDLGPGSLIERRALMRAQYDRWRRGIVCEPRGYAAMVGALLLPPNDPGACTGVIFFNNSGYLSMCGHGSMGVVRTLRHLGRIGHGVHRIETPAGMVVARVDEDDRISIDNVASYRYAAGVQVEVPGYGKVHGDVAWGGNWFFLVDEAPVPVRIEYEPALRDYATAIRNALTEAGITGAGGSEIDHIEVSGPPSSAKWHSRNYVLCPGLVYDRSPCGTGTSAKLACLADSGRLAEGETWRQESIIGSVFEASWRKGARGMRGIWPTISGPAAVVAQAHLLFDESDPFCYGSGAA